MPFFQPLAIFSPTSNCAGRFQFSRLYKVMEPTDSFSTGLEVCSEVLLFLASQLHRLHPGAIFEFISVDRNAAQIVIPWAETRGFRLLDVQEIEGNRTRFLIQR